MVLTAPVPAVETERGVSLAVRGRALRILDDPAVAVAAAEFTGGFEEGTLQLFDAVLPGCERMVDFGAYVGFTSLYAATHGAEVFAFEPSPTNFALLRENVALNPSLAGRIRLHRHAVGDRDGTVTLYAKGFADSGSSLFRDVERGGLVRGAMDARVTIRHAGSVLREIGLSERTLLKIDIEGAEYALIPAIAELLAALRPVLYVSFHPFNIVLGPDPYLNAVARIGRAMQVAEALACYPHMYCYTGTAWIGIELADRLDFLRHYLLRPKPVTRIGTPQYGFTDSLAFAARPLPLPPA